VGRLVGGRFAIVERLGGGSMGVVYRAEVAGGNDVAVKILRRDRALDDNARARFLREAMALSVLNSPHAVAVFDFGQVDTGEPFIVMEMLEGESLAMRLRRVGRFDLDAAIDATTQALRALSEAHRKGIVHRDVKPDNLFFARTAPGSGRTEIIKILDFGVAKLIEQASAATDPRLTLAGTVIGTPCYMSPEQAQGRMLDSRSDLYSLAVVLYELLTGRPPFIDDTNILVMARHIKAEPPSIRDVAPEAVVPPELETVLMRALAKDPARRPATAEAMIADLQRAQEARRSGPSRVRPAARRRREPQRRPTQADETVEIRGRSRRRRNALLGLTGLAMLAVLAVLGASLGARVTGALKQSAGTVRKSHESSRFDFLSRAR
jgi:serine/threonine-protein kinase